MLQYQNIPEFKMLQEIDINKLKIALNVPIDAYEGRLDNFRQKVLEDPIAEINEKTIYQMSYKVINQLVNLGFNLKVEQEILNACYSEDYCLNRIVTTQKNLQKQKSREKFPVGNELGFIRTAIIENWHPDSKRRPKPPISKPQPLPTPRKIFEENRKNKEPFVPPKINSPKKQEISVGI